MERCNECVPLEEAVLEALKTYTAILDAQIVRYRSGDGAIASENEPRVYQLASIMMDANGKLEDHREQHRIAQRMKIVRLSEIGRFNNSDGVSFATSYEVGGLPDGDHCGVVFAGPNQWRIDWHRLKNGVLERIPMRDVLYDTPDLALEAIKHHAKAT